MRRLKLPNNSRTNWSRLLGGCALVAGSIVGTSFSCTQLPPRSPESAPPAEKSEKRVQPATVEAEEEQPQSSYADALRRRQFERAAWLIDGATEEEQGAPEVRYARALVALELGDLETALRKVDGLEKKWPAFEQEAKDVRLEVAKRSQDVSLLSAFLSPVDSTSNQLLLAEAHINSASAVEARKLLDSALSSLQKSKSKSKTELALTVRAHALKARTLIAEGDEKQAAQELRWLAVQAPDTSPDSLALDAAFDEKMRALDPSLSLTTEERKKRAEAFAEQGWVEATEKELAALARSGATLKEADAILAWAVYTSRTDYERAASLFLKASKSDPKNRIKHLYYEAKSLARSNRDSDAIVKYQHVAQLGGEYADHAAFQAGRLLFIDGQWKAAVKSLDQYLKKYLKNARHRSDAEYTRAVARLAAEDYKAATSELSGLLSHETSIQGRAQLMQLIGLSMQKSGNLAGAAQMYRDVVDYRPLSLPAHLATARLLEMEQPAPPLILPAPPKTPPVADTQKPLSLSLPEKVWRLGRVGLDAQAEDALRHAEGALRIKYGKRRGEALCQMYGQLQSAERRYQIAQTAASWASLKFAPDQDTRWEWDCIYPQPYEEIVSFEANLRAIPAALVYGVMRQESAFRPEVVSPAKAVGLMQIIGPTAERIAQEIDVAYQPDLMRSPATNIQFGAYYLRRLLDMFDNRVELAAAAYNAGPSAVSRWLRKGENLPLDIFVARIPYDETRNYVYKVVGNYLRYSYLEDPSAVPQIPLSLPQGLKAPDDAY